MYSADKVTVVTKIPKQEYHQDEFIHDTLSHSSKKPAKRNVEGKPRKPKRYAVETFIITPICIILSWPIISLVLSAIWFILRICISF